MTAAIIPLGRSLHGYGRDDAAATTDILTGKLFEYLRDLHRRSVKTQVLDLGCGHGHLALRLMRANVHVRAVDIQVDNLTTLALAARAAKLEGLLSAVHNTFGLQEFWTYHPGPYHAVLLMRSLLFVPHNQAAYCLAMARKSLLSHSSFHSSGRLFAVVHGVECPLGQRAYPSNEPLENRHCMAANAEARNLGISQPVTLYSAAELRWLVESAGFALEYFHTGAYGMHKVVASPRH